MKSTYAILQAGYRASGDERRKSEADKEPAYRGGSVGIVLTSDGDMSTGYDTAGTCQRRALARYWGSPQVETADDDPMQIMFEGGLVNEDLWCALLDKGLPDGWSYKREEEVPVVWYTDAMTPVTGRPDIILFDEKGKPVRGLELKTVNSVWVARDALLECKPKLINLIQSAHYSMKHDIPWELWYTNRSNFTAEEWALRILPDWGDKGSEYLKYSLGTYAQDGVYKSGKRKGEPKWVFRKIEVPEAHRGLSAPELKDQYGVTHGRFRNIQPFHYGYELQWGEGGQFQYRPLDEPDSDWIGTPITKENITSFYNLLDKLQETKDLGPRPLELSATGEEKKGWSPCTYCPLSLSCDKYDEGTLDYEGWKKEVQKPDDN